ncbi:MAG: 50S ribosomal protein L25 [Chloroflexota bacterium]
MAVLKLKCAPRTVTGKKTRFLRRGGVTPTHLFGHGLESLALQCDTAELQRIISQAGMTRPITIAIDNDKTPRSVFVREVQKAVLSRELLHVDFYEVKKGEKITVDVPLVFVGEALAMKGKGRILTTVMITLPIECTPELIPPQIEVDISPLDDLDKVILVKDIKLNPGIAIKADPEQLVVKVSEFIIKEEEVAPVVEVAAEAVPAEGAEGEAPAEAKAGKGAEKAAPEKAGGKAEKAGGKAEKAERPEKK